MAENKTRFEDKYSSLLPSRRMTQAELDSFLETAADLLRGNIDHSEFRGYVFALLFFKRISDLFEESVRKLEQELGPELAHDPSMQKKSLPFVVPKDCLEAAKPYFPSTIPYRAVAANLESLADFRNNAIHFYNEPGLDVILYGLAQTSIVNFRDLFELCFNYDIANEVNLSLMPLSFRAPPDPIAFIRKNANTDNRFLSAYLHLISETTQNLERDGVDTGRFLTVFTVNLQSTKKIASADVVAGVQTESPEGVLLVDRRIDPNKSHPLRQKDILDKIGATLKGRKFNSYVFQAIVWRLGVKDKPPLCWRADHLGSSPQYSHELVSLLKGMTAEQINTALNLYKQRND